jgi:hypothetical protein
MQKNSFHQFTLECVLDWFECNTKIVSTSKLVKEKVRNIIW